MNPDSNIIKLFQLRSELAPKETKNKYGKLIYSVAYNLLKNHSDAEECENDTYFGLWNSIPPAEPDNFKAFCLKITRNIALKKMDYYRAEKRDCTKTVSYEEIIQEVGELTTSTRDIRESELTECINDFLENLSPRKRKIFVMRYWYMLSVKEIMSISEMSKSQVESILCRERKALKKQLVERGYFND